MTKTLALLASPGMLLPFFRYTTYLALDAYPPEARMATLWFDRCFLFSFAILVMGGVTVLEWDALFPDRRDYVSLIPLPIRARTIFLAKVGALVLFLLGFTAAVSAVSTVVFPIISYRFTNSHTLASVGLKTLAGFGGLGWTIAAQGISVLAASAFVFLSLIAMEGLLLNILSMRRVPESVGVRAVRHDFRATVVVFSVSEYRGGDSGIEGSERSCVVRVSTRMVPGVE